MLTVVAGVLLLLPWGASANPQITARCAGDSLPVSSAAVRLEWMRRCALAGPSVPGTLFDTGALATDNLTHLMDYNDGAEPYSFVSDINAHDVNDTYVFLRYLAGGTTQALDAQGFYKWARASMRPRPLYPTFGTSPDINLATQLYPHPYLANCQLYYDQNGTIPATAFYVNAFCEAACYTPDQKVLFAGGPMAIGEARRERREDLVTLSKDATLDNLELMTNQTHSYTDQLRDETHLIYNIRTRSGGQLRVTDEHPVVQAEGILVQARTLKVGDELLKKDGSADPIVSIEKTKYFGRVYSLRPVTSDPVTNILVAEDFLVGSVAFQNDDLGYINRRILYRSVLPGDIIP
jgi:hypothetical protein